MDKRILVAYATKCGSTAEVAEAIAEALRAQGAQVDAQSAKEVHDLNPYDGIVLGTAIRMGRPLRDAQRFVRKHGAALAKLPVAYFCVCGALKDDTPENRHKAEAYLASLVEAVTPTSVGLFGGCFDFSKLGPIFRFIFSRSKDEGLSEGDYRDWDAIRSWAESLITVMGLA